MKKQREEVYKMKYNIDLLNKYYKELEQASRGNLDKAINKIIEVKKRNTFSRNS